MLIMTMKSTEAIQSSFVRPKLNDRHHNTIQPLWMRVLEEKYQKLQLKIAQSTATMNGIYNSAIGRSIYDSKLVRASLQRSKEQQQPVKHRNANFEIKGKISATQITSNPGLSKSNIPSSIDKNMCKNNINSNKDKERNLFERINSDDESVNNVDKGANVKEQGTKVSEILYLQYDKTQPTKKNIHDLLTKRKNKIIYGDIKHVGDSNNIANTDTSSSRYSYSTQKTIKSCPNRLNSDIISVRKMPRADSGGTTRVNRRKMKMFSRMSAEAQTALTETIMENRSEDNLDSDVEDAERVNEDIDNVFSNDSGIPLGEIVSNQNGENCNDSVMSMASRDSRSIHTRLPELPKENGDFHTLNNVRQVDCRVPGLGKYPFPSRREVTFEITPPGFDIRYKDAPIREERESETPPPEIRDRAIRKCQDWLTRYTPRTPRPSQTSN